ncbi:uncharacterized protein A4U43_C01F13640 [Asparagus officinalis]|uniref:Uncharacterized protein n=1 Tax=Asparagus officinalis TaxID=4686 RepID=A0A5P1FRL7_ASPOF|nr:uncharacterized protein A4U43_C01F13640 [Asparagus officinalis]
MKARRFCSPLRGVCFQSMYHDKQQPNSVTVLRLDLGLTSPRLCPQAILDGMSIRDLQENGWKLLTGLGREMITVQDTTSSASGSLELLCRFAAEDRQKSARTAEKLYEIRIRVPSAATTYVRESTRQDQ